MEIDIRLSADGVPVLMHDETVERTTNRTGRVASLMYSELAGADAGGGQPVPALEQVLDAVDGRLVVMCELKSTPGTNDQDSRLVEAILRVVRRHGSLRWTAVHSFNPEIVRSVRELEPKMSTAIIAPPMVGDGLAWLLDTAVESGCQAVSLEHSCLTAESVHVVSSRQLTVWAWTPDTEDDWRRLSTAGVGGIITNYPRRLREFPW